MKTSLDKAVWTREFLTHAKKNNPGNLSNVWFD